MARRSLDTDGDIVGQGAIASVDDLDDMIAGLPELTAVFPVRRHLLEQKRAVGIEYLNPDSPSNVTAFVL